jgi:hypothetical protein
MIAEVPQSSLHFLASEDILRGMELVLLGDLMQFFLQGVDGALAGMEIFCQFDGLVVVHLVLREFQLQVFDLVEVPFVDLLVRLQFLCLLARGNTLIVQLASHSG